MIRPLRLPDRLPTSGPPVSVVVYPDDRDANFSRSVDSVLNQSYGDVTPVVPGGEPPDLRASTDSLVLFLRAGDRFCDPQALSYLVAAIETGLPLATSGQRYVNAAGSMVGTQGAFRGSGHTCVDGRYACNRVLTGMVEAGPSLYEGKALLSGHPGGDPGSGLRRAELWTEVLLDGDLGYIDTELFETAPPAEHSEDAGKRLDLVLAARKKGFLAEAFDEAMALIRALQEVIRPGERLDELRLVPARQALDRLAELDVKGPRGEKISGISEVIDAIRQIVDRLSGSGE